MSESVFKEIITLVTFVLNNSHYYYKFKIDQGFINQLDILFLLD